MRITLIEEQALKVLCGDGGATANNQNNWTDWEDAVEQSGYNTRYALEYEYAGTPIMSMHIQNTDLYYDIFFTSWTGGNQGGGFSYTRIAVDEMGNQINAGLEPGASDTLNIIYEPEDRIEGVYSADIVFETNDPLNSEIILPITMNLNGIAIAEIESDTYIDFGQVYVGEQAVYEFQIFNLGTSTLSIESTLDGSEYV